MGTSQSEPKVPMSSLQKTYYVTKSIEGLLVILATLFVLTDYNEDWVPVILGFALILIVTSFAANERRERNPWYDLSYWLQKKQRSIAHFRSQAERATSPRYKRTMSRLYYESVGILVDDLKLLKILAISRGENGVADEIQKQIDENQVILAQGSQQTQQLVP